MTVKESRLIRNDIVIHCGLLSRATATFLPSGGEFRAMFERFPNEEIIVIHLSSGLSGTYSAARTAADMFADGRVTVIDSLSIGPALGWLVEVAAHGARMGWAKERIMAAVRYVRQHSFTTATFMDIKYLVHSGRVCHLRGIIASMLKIKPVIGLDDQDGKFCSLGQDLSLSRVIRKMVDLTHAKFGKDNIRLQLLHGHNLVGVEELREAIGAVMDCVEDPLVTLTSVLGAHAGPTVFGLAAIRTADYAAALKM